MSLHISRHTGRPTGRMHIPHHYRNHHYRNKGFRSNAIFVGGEHISRHTGRPTGRVHMHHHRPRRFVVFKSHPISFKMFFRLKF